MSKIDLKSTFIFRSDKSVALTKDFIQKDMGISQIKLWSSCGRDVLDVPKDKYEQVLLEGQRFAIEKKLESTSWVDHYNQLGTVGYMKMAYAFLGERQGDLMWCVKDCLPKEVLEYLKAMSNYLKTEVHHAYNNADNALLIQSKSLDYAEQFELLNEFTKQEGVGPFSKIKQMTFTGKLLNGKTYPVLKSK